MGRFCTRCGKEIKSDAIFCTECGAQDTAQTQGVIPVSPITDKKEDVVSLWVYFGLLLLFSLPVIGWISCIVFSFAPKSKNIKNFARAVLIIMVISILITILLVSVVGAFVMNFADEFGQDILKEFGYATEQLHQQADVAKQLQNGGVYSIPLE